MAIGTNQKSFFAKLRLALKADDYRVDAALSLTSRMNRKGKIPVPGEEPLQIKGQEAIDEVHQFTRRFQALRFETLAKGVKHAQSTADLALEAVEEDREQRVAGDESTNQRMTLMEGHLKHLMQSGQIAVS